MLVLSVSVSILIMVLVTTGRASPLTIDNYDIGYDLAIIFL